MEKLTLALSCLNLLLLLLNVWEKVEIRKEKSPNTIQNHRLDVLEKKMEQVEQSQKSTDDGNKVMYKAILALLSHGIDGNSVEPMREAKQDLEKYLINK